MNKKQYAYVGKHSIVGDLEFTSVGQRAEFTDEQYVECMRGGAMFIPIEDFEHVFDGFDKQEFAKYTNQFFFGEPSTDFTQRLEACRDVAREKLAESK